MAKKITALKKPSDFQSPGEALSYFLGRYDWTQEDLSYILSISLKHTNQLFRDKKPVSIEIAQLLEDVFEWGAKDWVGLSTKFQLYEGGNQDKRDLVRRKAQLSQHMPLNELIKKGWISKYDTKDQLEKRIRKFWGLRSNDDLDMTSLRGQVNKLKFKKSDKYHDTFNGFHAVIWAQMARNFSKSLRVAAFDKSGLQNLMDEMHVYTKSPNGVKRFIAGLSEVGVKFVFLSHLSKTYLDGAAFMTDDVPLVTLTGRYDRIDNFWFTLAHELSHVLLHLTNGTSDSIFIDDSTNIGDSKEEKEANQSAETALMLSEVLDFLNDNLNYLTVDKVIDCSNQLQLHASIIVGMLAHRGDISYSNLHRFKEPIRNQIPKKYKVEG